MADQQWQPQSPDLSAYAPQSPDFKNNNPPPIAWEPQSPNLPLAQYPPASQPPHFSLDNHSWDHKADHAFDYPSFSHHQSFYPPEMPATTRSARVKNEDPNWMPREPAIDLHQFPPDTKPAAQQTMDTRGIEVKTKFPTARIKRIMQADEDVGKVAQVTPVVMAKALELFMIRLITASADVAKTKGSKRVQTTHMKQAVMADDQFDNLREIVSKVPDAPAKKTARDSESDDEDGPKRRKKAAPKGKKRRDSEED